jgi:hypothetical protein
MLVSAGLFAADDSYRMEAGMGYFHNKDEDSVKQNGFVGYFDFYLSPVALKTHPLAEAAFLEKSSVVRIIGGYSDVDFPSSSFYRSGSAYTFGVQAAYLLPSTPIMLGISGSHSKMEVDTVFSDTYTAKDNAFSVNFGVYLLYGLYAGTEYCRTTTKSNIDSTVNENAFTFDIKYVTELNENNAFNIQAEYGFSKDTSSEPEKVHTFSLISDFYFFRQLGAGVSFESNNSNDNSDDTRLYGFHVIGFPLNSLRLELEYEHEKAVNSSGTDEDTFSAGLAYRF